MSDPERVDGRSRPILGYGKVGMTSDNRLGIIDYRLLYLGIKGKAVLRTSNHCLRQGYCIAL